MRKADLSFEEVARHFDLPLTQAAERLNVCATLVKRICRENGVSRWPHRQIQSQSRKNGELVATKPQRASFTPRRKIELSFEEVARHFELPLTQAAERLNVCATLVKRICRKNGVGRWPYRKLTAKDQSAFHKKRQLMAANAMAEIAIGRDQIVDRAQLAIVLAAPTGAANTIAGALEPPPPTGAT